MADFIELFQSEASLAYRNTTSEQSDGTLVPDALSYAQCFPIAHGIQGVVC